MHSNLSTSNFTKLSDFDYHLPEDLIAKTPLKERSESRLLVVHDKFEDLVFKDIVNYINPGDLLIKNDTKVIKARLFGNKVSGGKVEVMLERIIDDENFIAHIRTSKSIPIGLEIILPSGLIVRVIKKLDGLFLLKANNPLDLYTYLEKHGNVPLPPYMKRMAELDDTERYQTVYARHSGSLAAPTAGLHFTEDVLTQIKAKGANISEITLHIGSGTFKPVSTENISDHKMHSESFSISNETVELIKETKARKNKVIAVGTTTLRTLESVAKRGLSAQSGETDIFITQGFKFQIVDQLITNFHLPKSTLLMLVAAFSGKNLIDKAYEHAINNRYRFFSYGDAMLLTCDPGCYATE